MIKTIYLHRNNDNMYFVDNMKSSLSIQNENNPFSNDIFQLQNYIWTKK